MRPTRTRRTIRTWLAAAAVAALAITSLAATPEDYAVSVDELQATSPRAGALEVAGAISWAGAVEINRDDTGDATIPGIGTDMENVYLSREMGSGTLTFTMNIADGIPTHGGPNEVFNWGVPLTVGSDTQVDLQAWRSAQFQRPESTDPYFSVNVCSTDPDTGQNTCTTTEVGGEFTEDHITWRVPMFMLSADAGVPITAGQAWAAVGAIGLVWFTGGAAASDMMPTWNLAYVPGEVALEVARDDSGEVVATSEVEAGNDGSFAETFRGLEPGDYTVTATTCFNGFEDCASTSTPVSVS